MNPTTTLTAITPSRWRLPLATLVLLLAALLLLYLDTARGMVEIWTRNDTFAHGYLVLPMTLWMVWRQRAALAMQTPRPWPLMLLPLAVLTALWALADLVNVNAAAQFAFVGMLIVVVPLVLGPAVARQIVFPLLFLLFAVPFGEFMLEPMMNWTADFVVWALRMSGIPVYREGLFFVIPSGNWSVIDECSGVRYLIASFMVGSLFAYLNYRSLRKRTIFMLVSLLTPIVANWLRAYLIVLMGHLSNNKIATGVDHLLYGWVFFGVVIMIMFMIGMRWSDSDGAQPLPQGEASSELPARPARVARAVPVALGAALLLAWPHGAISALQGRERAAAAPQMQLPQTIQGWQLAERPALDWAPSWHKPRLELHRGYANAGQPVGVYVAYYRGQDAQSKLVSSLNAVVAMNDRRWNVVGTGTGRPDAAGGWGQGWREYDLLGPELRVGGASRPQVVARAFYWVDGRIYASDVAAKLATLWSRLRGQLDDGAALVIYASADSFTEARQRVQAFQAAALPPLTQTFAATSQRH